MSLSTNTTYRVFVEKLGDSDPTQFVGNEGEVFYDPSSPSLFLSDGSTAGGVPIAGGGGSSQWTTTGNGIYYNGGNVAIGTNVVSAGSTTLLVDGNARITGILSIGTGTITLDPSENKISIGTAITLNADTGTIDVFGSTVANTTGDAFYIGTVTATAFVGDGSGLTNLPGGGAFSYCCTNNITSTDLTSHPDITTASDNFFAGVGAGCSITNGVYNNFFGRRAGRFNTSGSYNNFLGYYAGNCNTIGSDNNFFGDRAGYDNIDGNYNNFFGYDSGYSNISGDNNNFLGSRAGNANTTGCNNNFLGYNAGRRNTTGCSNNFFGLFAGCYNTTGCDNNFLGFYAGRYNSTGCYNNFFGRCAGYFNFTCSNNIALGNNSGNDAVYNFGSSPASDIIVLGNNSHTNAYIKIAWTVTSDERDKNIIGNVPYGLSFVQQITPIEYHWKNRETNEITDNKSRYGFKAQEILNLEGENPVLIDDTDENNLKLRESMLIPVLVNSIKELSARLEAIESHIGIGT